MSIIMPTPETTVSPEMQRLILLTESVVHFLCRAEMTRDEAIDLKGRLTRPLGVLNSKNGLRSEAEAKRVVRHGKMCVDTSTPKD